MECNRNPQIYIFDKEIPHYLIYQWKYYFIFKTRQLRFRISYLFHSNLISKYAVSFSVFFVLTIVLQIFMRIEFYAFSYISFIKKYFSSYTVSTYEQYLVNSEFLYIENSIVLFSRNGCHLKSFVLVIQWTWENPQWLL